LSITPNQQVVYNKDLQNFIKRDVDAELLSIWLEGKFYFEKEELGDIVKKLERNYNVSIAINSERLNKLVFTGLIDKRLNVFQTLDIMRRYNAFNYKVKLDSIIITDK
jgi:ferric-dicitrate binding protein FerR (iron transport regulator)